ncbi:hypothetical protein ACX1C1_02275 [Paenibacillus sp. strain BS8-2]
MKNLLKKSLVSLGLAACFVGAVSSVSFASIAWDSDASWTGIGGKAQVYAYTSQSNESWNYHIRVEAYTNDGSSRSAARNPALETDMAYVNFVTAGAVSSGSSFHEWIMNGDEAAISKVMDFN